MKPAFVALLCLGITGCVTKKLVVFEALSDRQMAQLMGDYDFANDGITGGKLRFKKQGTEYRFEVDWETSDRKKNGAKGQFFLSAIPISKRRSCLGTDRRSTLGTDELYVISSPDLKCSVGADFSKNTDDNFWGILKKDGHKLHFWMISGPRDLPVAKENLTDATNAQSVKRFLKRHAVEFTQANKPTLTFSKIKK